MESQYIREGKEYILRDNEVGLETVYQQIQNFNNQKDHEYQINYQNVYQKLLLFACIKHAKDCIFYLVNVYFEFDDITQIALRQSFYYGKYLMKNS